MRKILLSLVAFLCTLYASAQVQRVVLFEEFSGENCAPCAAVNPDLNDFISNYPDDVILLKYQVPIPSAGPIYYQNSADANSRRTYYGVNSAPWGEQDGMKWNQSQSNHPAYWIQTTSYVDNRLQVSSPFALDVEHIISADADSFYCTVQIAGAANYTVSATGKLRLRLAMIEDLDFLTPPGTNGETSFHHVMREMYPTNVGSSGTLLQDSWNVGSNQTLTFSGKFPTYIYDKTKVRFVAFIQDDNNKEVQQSAISLAQILPYDIKSEQLVNTFYTCGADFTPVVTVSNNGSTTLTTASLDVYVDNVFHSTYPWTGNLAQGSSQNITLYPVVGSPSGSHTIKVIATSPNGYADLNNGNDTASSSFAVGPQPAQAPLVEGFESGAPSGWVIESGATTTWSLATVGSNSSKSYKFDYYNAPGGTVGYLYLPRLNLVGYSNATIQFDRAHAQYQFSSSSTSDDLLEIEVSSNCGQSWQTVWNKSGSALATTDTSNRAYTPLTGEWDADSASLTNTVANRGDVLIRFKGTSDYGNNAYIDNINVYQFGQQVSGVEEVAIQLNSVYPNPANDHLNAEIAIDKSAEVTMEIYDLLGHRVYASAKQMPSGLNLVNINTTDFAQSSYLIYLTINGNKAVKKFDIVR